MRGLALGVSSQHMCPLEEAESLEGGRPALAWPVCPTSGMYFGVSERPHLLSQKQVWSGPSGLQPQGKRILNSWGPGSLRQPGGVGPRGAGRAFWEGTDHGTSPIHREI